MLAYSGSAWIAIKPSTSEQTNINTLAGLNTEITALNGIKTEISALDGIKTEISNVNGISSEIQAVSAVATQVGSAPANATKAENYAVETDSTVTGTSDDSAKSWAIGGSGSYSMRTSGKGSAKEWAAYTTGKVDGTSGTSDYSAKNYAISGSVVTTGSAKNWAVGGGDSFATSTTVGTTGLYSAKYYAEQAAASKTEFSNVYQGALASDPSGGTVSAGDLYFNTSTTKLKYYNGSAWQNIEATDTSSFAQKGFAIAMAIAL